MTVPSALDLARLRELHRNPHDPFKTSIVGCEICMSTYPCDTIRLCDEIYRLRAENERLHDALSLYGKHEILCRCSQFQEFDPARRPLAWRYAGEWYDERGPECSCGLRAALGEKENGE